MGYLVAGRQLNGLFLTHAVKTSVVVARTMVKFTVLRVMLQFCVDLDLASLLPSSSYHLPEADWDQRREQGQGR